MTALAGREDFCVIPPLASPGALIAVRGPRRIDRPIGPGQAQASDAFATPTIVHFGSLSRISVVREPDATDQEEVTNGAIVAPHRLEELPHSWRRGGSAGKRLDAQAFEHQAKDTLMLVERGGLITSARKRWTDENRRDTTSAVRVIVL
jgi:hypothetical protein